MLNSGAKLTLTGCLVTANAAQRGGGVASVAPGDVGIVGSTVSDNNAVVSGGGVWASGPIALRTSVVSGNTAGGGAGGIDVAGAGVLTLVDSTVSDNGGIGGGGVRAASTLRGSTIAANRASFGGGIFVPPGAVLEVVNSTVSGNTSTSDGGGLFVSGTVALFNVTVAANTADVDTSGSGNGGGLLNSLGSVTIRNTLLGGNVDGGGEAPQCSGTVTSAGHNLLESATGCVVGGDPTGNLIGVVPGLGQLLDNGGPTATHALMPGSQAVDAGEPTGCRDGAGTVLDVDQRGLGRPAGAACDIGAFEQGAVPTTTTTTTSTSTTTTTTMTGAPTTTTTLPPPECIEGDGAGCDDGEPCTADDCVAGRCVHADGTGAESARCVCARPPSPPCAGELFPVGIDRHRLRACGHLARLSDATPRRRARRILRRAIHHERAAARLVDRALLIGGECAAALRDFFRDAEGRARALRERL